MRFKVFFVILLIVFMPIFGSNLKLASIIGDNAVIQQNTEIKLFGWDVSGTIVRATSSWKTESVETITASDGKRQLSLKKTKASREPLNICFSYSRGDTIIINNLLSGEVWLASGQSNT